MTMLLIVRVVNIGLYLFFHFHFITLDLDIYDGHITPSLLSLLLLSCMVVPIRELANILYPVTSYYLKHNNHEIQEVLF